MPDRILIIGSPGSGKSTLARALAAKTGLPVYHLDQLRWRPGWVEVARAVFDADLDAALAEPRWIIDGNYSHSLPRRLARSEQVVLLDLPAWRCTWRMLKRVWTGRGRTRPDMAPDCPEQFNLPFIWYVMTFGLFVLPRTEASLADFTGDLVRLRSDAEVAHYLARDEGR